MFQVQVQVHVRSMKPHRQRPAGSGEGTPPAATLPWGRRSRACAHAVAHVNDKSSKCQDRGSRTGPERRGMGVLGRPEPTGEGELLLTMLGCRSDQDRPPLGVRFSSSPLLLWTNGAAALYSCPHGPLLLLASALVGDSVLGWRPSMGGWSDPDPVGGAGWGVVWGCPSDPHVNTKQK